MSYNSPYAMVTQKQAKRIIEHNGGVIRLKIRGARGAIRKEIEGVLTIPSEIKQIIGGKIELAEEPELKGGYDWYREYLKQIENDIGNKQTSQSELQDYVNQYWDGQFGEICGPNEFKPKKNSYNIVNTEEAPGMHWLGIYVDKKGTITAYDSFGRRVLYDGKRVQMSEDDPEQSPPEDNCGQRSLAWLLVVKNHGLQAALEI